MAGNFRRSVKIDGIQAGYMKKGRLVRQLLYGQIDTELESRP